MGGIYDLFPNAWNFGWEKAIIILLLSFVLYTAYQRLQSLFDQTQALLRRVNEVIDSLHEAALEEDGRVVSQAKQLHILEDVARQLQAHSEKCLAYHSELAATQNNIREVRSDIEQFVTDGKEARANTQRLVESIGDRLDGFIGRVVEILRLVVEREHGSREK